MVRAEERILVFNAGSATLKLGVFAADGEQLGERHLDWQPHSDTDHAASIQELLHGVDVECVGAIGHRVVHGGSRFTTPVLIDALVRDEIASLATLAPLHNSLALLVIDEAARRFPGAPQVAVFDSAFHATLPPHSYLYALPYGWYEQWGVRRFGFHGLSHAYCTERTAELLGRSPADLNIITCHLGGGCSLAAIAGGRSVATTMGFTPLDGLMMATRPGCVDPGILTYLLSRGDLTLAELDQALLQDSGLRGVSGLCGDMREILSARATGHVRAQLAFDLFVTRLREGIAAMMTHLDGLDALVFTGGIGEGSAEVRSAACAGLGWAGIPCIAVANEEADADCPIGATDSRVQVLVLHTREDLMVARQTGELLGLWRA